MGANSKSFRARLFPLQFPVVERGALARVELDDLEIGRKVEVARDAERRMARPQQAALRAPRGAAQELLAQALARRCRACGDGHGEDREPDRPKASASSDEQIVSVSRAAAEVQGVLAQPGGIIWKGSMYRVRSQMLRRSYARPIRAMT